MTGICLPNESFYTDTRVQDYVLDNFKGIAFAGKRQGLDFYLANKDSLNKSIDLDGSNETDLIAYFDEPSHDWHWIHKQEGGLDKLIKKHSNAIIGDLNKSSLKKYAAKYPNITLTYTAYRDMWFNFYDCGWDFRIPAWFGLIATNQIKTWEWMQKEFGDRFSICWINLTMNKDKKELIEWAEAHNKETWLYVEYNMTIKEILKISN